MKPLPFIACLAAIAITGCADTRARSADHHLTEAQVIALAKLVQPLQVGESYHTHFKNGIWEVYSEPNDGKKVEHCTVVEIQDTDGKILGSKTYL
jgi:hypothetical protein